MAITGANVSNIQKAGKDASLAGDVQDLDLADNIINLSSQHLKKKLQLMDQSSKANNRVSKTSVVSRVASPKQLTDTVEFIQEKEQQVKPNHVKK